jgi:hypothetical protein
MVCANYYAQVQFDELGCSDCRWPNPNSNRVNCGPYDDICIQRDEPTMLVETRNLSEAGNYIYSIPPGPNKFTIGMQISVGAGCGLYFESGSASLSGTLRFTLMD